MKPAGKYLHFEGTYRGVYRAGSVRSNLGKYVFKEIDWIWIEVSPTLRLEERNAKEEQVLDFYFAPQLPKKKTLLLPGKSDTQVILLGPNKKAFAGTIYDVVLSQQTTGNGAAEITILDPKGRVVSNDGLEISGKIRFSIPDPSFVPPPKPSLAPLTKPILPAIHKEQVINYRPTENIDISNANGTDTVRTTDIAIPTPAKPHFITGCLGNIIGLFVVAFLFKLLPILGIIAFVGLIANFIGSKARLGKEEISSWGVLIMLGGIVTCIHAYIYSQTIIFYGVLFFTLCYLVSRVQTKPVWRAIFGILMHLTLIAYWMQYLHIDWQKYFNKPRTENRTKTKEPVPIEVTDKDGKKVSDSLYTHEVHWNDFVSRTYNESYNTTSRQYNLSKQMHNSLASIRTGNSQQQFWSTIYNSLIKNDAEKIDSLAQIFIQKRAQLNLNENEAAEMVVTFIQEIPYYLLHEGTCKEASNAGNEFMTDYHKAGKPCLGGLFAGIQSPYEFVHNLKGDCDTRSVLCYALLSKMSIPSSVWVSETYGHSIIGIGVPASGNNFKTINGHRHFATELTSKGFRVGMISPNHTNMNNWTITIKTP